MARKLSVPIQARVNRLCAEGNALCQQGLFPEARGQYIVALHETPDPWEDFESTTSTLTAIGDTFIGEGEWEKARDAFLDAMGCPGGIGNPYIHLRLGEAQFELANLTRAADELARAYMGGGKEIFESEDPKYFAFVKTKLREPSGGW